MSKLIADGVTKTIDVERSGPYFVEFRFVSALSLAALRRKAAAA